MSHFRFWMLALAVSVPAVAAPQAVDPESSFNAGLNHLREGRPGMAVEAFRKAVREDGKNPYFQKGLGQAYLASGKYDDAIASFHKALELNQYYVDVRNDLVEKFSLRGARRLIAVSGSLAERLRERGFDTGRICQVPNGVPVAERTRRGYQPGQELTLGMIALYRPRKGKSTEGNRKE